MQGCDNLSCPFQNKARINRSEKCPEATVGTDLLKLEGWRLQKTTFDDPVPTAASDSCWKDQNGAFFLDKYESTVESVFLLDKSQIGCFHALTVCCVSVL